MEKPKELKWNIEDEEVYIDYHTSYIGDHFYNQVLSKRTASFTDQKKVEEEKTQKIKAYNDLDLLFEAKDKEFEIDKTTKRIETSIIEFDWIFQGPKAVGFIKMLAQSNDDNVFATDTIRIIISFLW